MARRAKSNDLPDGSPSQGKVIAHAVPAIMSIAIRTVAGVDTLILSIIVVYLVR